MTGLALSKCGLIAADHDGQHAVFRAGLAAGHRCIEKAKASRLGGVRVRARLRAEAVVLSMKIAPFSWSKSTALAGRDRTQIVVIANAGEDEILVA
jgi:hypothetical protein